MTHTVRIAQPSEEPALIEMCRALHKENGLFDFTETKVRDCLRSCFERRGGIVGVIGEPDKVEACICLQISDLYYTDQWHLAELWTYVGPQYRKSNHIQTLLEFAKKSSDQIGIPLIVGIITHKRLAGKVRLYRRAFGNPAGAFFVYNGNWIGETKPDFMTTSFYDERQQRRVENVR